MNDLSLGKEYNKQDYLIFLFTKKKSLEPQPVKTKVENEQPKTFEELFYDENLVLPCLDVLRKIDPPLIDADANYIGNSKGAICIWVDEMTIQGIAKSYTDRKIYANLLPQKIKRFSIDESMFGKYHKRAEENYRTDIKTLISQKKLSQSSQRGKLRK